jgi:hypothetical protein
MTTKDKDSTFVFLTCSKKAQIGATLTWFVAFIIIFFIMALFIFFCTILIGEKKATSSLSWDILNIEDSSNYQNVSLLQDSLIVLLNSPIGENKNFYDFLSEANEGDETMKEVYSSKIKDFAEKNRLSDSEGSFSSYSFELLKYDKEKKAHVSMEGYSISSQVKTVPEAINPDNEKKDTIIVLIVPDKILNLNVYSK